MLHQPGELASAAVLVIGLTACGFDVATRRIPNLLTFGAAIAGLVFAILTGGLSGLALSLGGLAVGLAIFFPIFLLRGIGAGDVKLLACLGAWFGPLGALWTALYAALVGGAMAVVVILSRGYVKQAFANIRLLLTHWSVVGVKPLPELTLERGRGPRLAYAVPIFTGALVTLWLR
jgi:prepilin peptidase CpaA